jgi:hypothetical protein
LSATTFYRDDIAVEAANPQYGAELARQLHAALAELGISADIHASAHAGPEGDEAEVSLGLDTAGAKMLTAVLRAANR